MEFLVSYQTRGGIHLLALLSRSGADFRSYQLVGEPIQLARVFFDAGLGQAAKVVSESKLLCFFRLSCFFFNGLEKINEAVFWGRFEIFEILSHD